VLWGDSGPSAPAPHPQTAADDTEAKRHRERERQLSHCETNEPVKLSIHGMRGNVGSQDRAHNAQDARHTH